MDATKMDNSIKIWSYIRPFLVENADLQVLMNVNNILPLVVNENTPYPFVVYRRENISVTYTKPIAGGFDNRVTLSLDVYSNDYEESCNILNLIRNILEQFRFKNEEIIIHELEVIGVYESYSQDGYKQTIQFQAWVE